MAEKNESNNTPKNLLLPYDDKVVPKKLGSSTSATGNPRNKCALKPGHSLMDWIRLGNSGVDLSGTSGAIKSISQDELSKHNTLNDAWISIRGRVYNITRYMDFHPGGVDELMRGAGKDATKLFEEIHAWVNYEQLLSKCFIGPYLGKVVKIDNEFLSSIKVKTNSKQLAPLLTSGETQNSKNSLPSVVFSLEVMPRFDWIQKHSDITFYFYTGSSCNPGFLVKHCSEKRLLIHIFIEQKIYAYTFDIKAEFSWPPIVYKTNSDSGKIEISFGKVKSEIWSSYGSHSSCNVQQQDDFEMDFQVKKVEMINHDSFQLDLQALTNCILLPPVASHVSITAKVNGEYIQRSYTPVPHKFLYWNSLQDLSFLIKVYDDGLVSKSLRHMNPQTIIKLSQPKGNLKLRSLLLHNRIALIAAGSGITPMLSLIEHLLQRSSCKIEKLLLVLYNKTVDDIWCKDTLNILHAQDERFQVKHILSQPDENWNGDIGRISSGFFTALTKEYTFLCLCGPRLFNEAATNFLKLLQIPDINIHIFN